MIKTWLKDALRNIRKRFVSWLSIVTIVLIGTTLILGLFFGSSTVKKAGTSYIDQQNFRDFAITSTIGVKEEDVDAIKKLDDVIDAEGQISFSGQAALSETSIGVMVLSSTERISIPTVMAGALPSSEEECIISLSAMDKIGASIGDIIEIEVSAERYANVLKHSTYKITGIASHPDYMVNIATDYVVIPLSSFDTSVLAFDYSSILVDADIPQDTFKSGYTKRSTEIKTVLEEDADSIFRDRFELAIRDLDTEYENAKKQANEELSKGEEELNNARTLYNDTINSAREQLEAGEKQLGDMKAMAEQELADAEKKIREGEEEYNTKIAEGEQQLADAEKQLEDELAYSKWVLFDSYLKLDQAEKYLKEKEEEYRIGSEKLAEGHQELEENRTKYNEAIAKIDNSLNDGTIDQIIAALEEISPLTPRIEEIIGDLRAAKGKNTMDRSYALLAIYDGLTAGIDDEIMEKINDNLSITEFRNGLNTLSEGKQLLEEGQRRYDEAKEQLEEARKLLDQGWYDLEKGKRQLADGEAELARREPEARQQLADAKAQFEEQKAEGARQLKEAKDTLDSKKAEAQETIKTYEEELNKAKEEFNSQKEEGKKSLDEAQLQYDEAKQEVEGRLAETRLQIDEVKNAPLSSIVQSRDVNFPYVQTRSYIKAIDGFFGAFTPFYAGIIAIVCFFTMTIIIEEQTSQIGTCKAFGMYESEIMRKYLIFGGTAALFGALFGIAGAFAIEKFLISTMRSNLAFSLDGTGHNVLMIILLPVMELIITCGAVLWSCHRYIKCSAVGLMNGSEPAARYRTKSGISFSKSLYTNLIINNLFTDMGREVVSVVTILICVFIVGFGIDIKMAYEGALKRQMNDIWQFDITLTESGTITEEEKDGIKKALSGYDCLYLPITVGVISQGDSQVMTNIICVDDRSEFERFYTLRDSKGRNVSISETGVLVTKEMVDKNGLLAGSSVHLAGGNLSYADVSIDGEFMLYAGKTMIMTDDFFEEKLGTAPVCNTYYIKASGADAKQLRDKLSDLPGVLQVELTKNLRDRNMAVVNLYNAVVVIVILFSVLLSFMILLNLSNILVAHRMKEILTMRVNGFSNAHVIGYLVREVVLIGVISVVLALSIGVPLTSVIIKNLETDAFMFVRTPFVQAWTGSVLVNVLFSLSINSLAFRKVNAVPLTDITKY